MDDVIFALILLLVASLSMVAGFTFGLYLFSRRR